MSLTLPAAYSSASKQGNIQENWIIQLGFFNGDAQGSGEGGWEATLQSSGDDNTVNESVDNSETDIDVLDGTVFQVGDFIKIDSEIMKILSISTNTITVERGAMNTTKVTHVNRTAIYWNNFTPIALSDTTVDDVFYHGVVTNTPSIRSSIDLVKAIAKTGNISLNVANFQYKGDDFSAELFLGTRKYINRNVKIYSQLNDNSTLSNCLQIYQGRLVGVSHDDSMVTLQLTEQRPWDFISIPQTKTSDTNIYFPIAYGNFTPNTTSRDYRAIKTVYPIPVNEFRGTQLYSLIGTEDVTSNAYPHYYDKGMDRFIPVSEDGAYNFDTDADSYKGGFAVQAHYELERRITFKPVETTSSTGWSNPDNAFDDADANEETNYASADFTRTNTGQASKTIKFQMPQIEGKVTAVSMEIRYYTNEITVLTSGTGTATYTLTNKTWGANDIFYSNSATSTGSDNSGGSGTTDTSGSLLTQFDAQGGWGDEIEIEAKVDITAGADPMSGQFQPRIYDVRILATTEVDWDEATNKARQTANKIVSDIETLYTGGDGLVNSWDSSAISYGHEAHRDMLIRYTGYTTTAPENWSALDEDRTRNTADDGDIATWKIRWWALEPVELKKVLEKLQYEFGFIFKFRADGTGSYIHVLQTSELSADQTLKKDDIANLKINNSSFSDLLTKMEINYEKHPAENRYLSSVTSTNSTARTSWNIQAKENISEVDLDMNVGTPNSSGQTDGNADFYSYYDNIFGDIKKVVTCDIVNPAVSYNLETGDIIQFSNTAGEMPVEPFGDDWQDYYMITDLQRSPGKIKIQAREVG